jgi:hypothetical protein
MKRDMTSWISHLQHNKFAHADKPHSEGEKKKTARANTFLQFDCEAIILLTKDSQLDRLLAATQPCKLTRTAKSRRLFALLGVLMSTKERIVLFGTP